ncbi:MAG TPA: hypothetical protein GXZ21_02815 [Clostridiales bacterium]|nr:hypothetical protein [Clostridiales bacterium]
MSNVIKAYTISYDKSVTKTINGSDNWMERVKDNQNKTPEVVETIPEDGFITGLNAVHIKEIASEEEQKEVAGEIILKAEKEAQEIIEQAKAEANKLKEEAYESSKKKGHEEGIAQGMAELKKMQEDLMHKEASLEQDYNNKLKDLEPQIAEIIGGLVRKIIGVEVEGREDLIIHLVKMGLKNQEKYNEFTIRVSSYDYEYANEYKETLISSLGREVELQFVEDPELNENECIIETNSTLINCSLGEQLKNLTNDLKLLGGMS